MRSPHLIYLALLFANCASTTSYIYTPNSGANAHVDGLPAYRYSIPRDHPTGDIGIASFGVTEVQTASDGPKVRALQVRVIITNASDNADWRVDTRDIIATIPPDGKSRPALVNTDAGTPPIIQVARGQQRAFDLYYPLPVDIKGEEQLPAFTVSWKIQAGGVQVAEQTSFKRNVTDSAVDGGYAHEWEYSYGYPYDYSYPYATRDYLLYPGLGMYWWYDPLYPDYAFYNYPILSLRIGPHTHFHVNGSHFIHLGYFGAAGGYGGVHYGGGHGWGNGRAHFSGGQYGGHYAASHGHRGPR